ncbi:uncharacterized protein DUF4307 [Glaciihabitans tibetensis]|uniref:Uncharacterized protein DUF4307 n=1 Tax=Glaciihabitans tibetensis TaxID=1266600 RepID=A0A2T0V4A0_9MICO|nr:DUF4307 domain-containing protein [Glaciihabitans tibetensis]PRY64990.1 uncharacterized protein DUF4307 [Glaciihabitans tibetensis]
MRTTTDEASETWDAPHDAAAVGGASRALADTVSGSGPGSGPDSSEINARYGRTPANRRRVRLWAWLTAAIFVVVLGAWLLWAGLLENTDALEAQNVAHTVVDDREVEVTWQLNAEPGTSTSCALQALNESFSIVGWKIVEIPPSELRTRSLTESVLTSEQSVTGLIYRCWLS